jgi:hypothetical protein
MFQIRASTMLRKKPENRYPYIKPHTAQCVGASIGQGGASIRQGGENTNRQAQAPMSGAGKVSDNDEAGGYDPHPLPSNVDELRKRRLQYFGRSGGVAVSVAATADPVAAQGHPEVVNAVRQVIVVTSTDSDDDSPFQPEKPSVPKPFPSRPPTRIPHSVFPCS